MNVDPRLYEIERTAADKEPTDVYRDEMAVVLDNLMSGYLSNPARTDEQLRRDGMTKTADRLTELFGPSWWERLT